MDKEMRALGKSTVPQPNMSHLSEWRNRPPLTHSLVGKQVCQLMVKLATNAHMQEAEEGDFWTTAISH